MRIVITGGAGFIGSRFVELACAQGTWDEVVVLDALTYAGHRENLDAVADSIELVVGDITDAALVDTVLTGTDLVVHFAAETHVDRSITGSDVFVRTNVVGTQVLLEAAKRHGVARFLHVSTDEVYGSITEGSWTEESPLAPNSPYSASKAGSDLLALAYHRTHGLDVVVTRCSNNYGPRQTPEKVIPLFVTNLLDGKNVPLYGDGRNVRDWLHVDDHGRGILAAIAHGRAGQVYNIGGGEELTNVELTERLLAAVGSDWSRVDHVADRLGHDLRYSLSHAKATAELGYVPQVGFEQGMAETIAWYRDNRAWWEPIKAGLGG
jgi:dTDP-glucose 4,6-dehydratase